MFFFSWEIVYCMFSLCRSKRVGGAAPWISSQDCFPRTLSKSWIPQERTWSPMTCRQMRPVRERQQPLWYEFENTVEEVYLTFFFLFSISQQRASQKHLLHSSKFAFLVVLGLERVCRVTLKDTFCLATLYKQIVSDFSLLLPSCIYWILLNIGDFLKLFLFIIYINTLIV